METQKLSTMYTRYTTGQFGYVATLLTALPNSDIWMKLDPQTVSLATTVGGIRITAGSVIAALMHTAFIKPRMPAQIGYESMVQMTFRTKSSAAFSWGLAWRTQYLGQWIPAGAVVMGTDGKLRIMVGEDGALLWSIGAKVSDSVTTILAESVSIPNYSYTEWTTWDLTVIFPVGGSNQSIRAILSINQRVAKEVDPCEDVVNDVPALAIGAGLFPIIEIPENVTVDVAMLSLVRS